MIDITEKKVPHLFRNKYLRNAGSGSVNTSIQSPGQSTPGASVDIVKTDSATVPTDGNVLSALRTLLEIRSRIIASADTETALSEENTLSSFRIIAEIDAAIAESLKSINELYLSRTKADTAAEAITFLKGLFVGDNLAFINASGDAEVKSLVARMKAKVATLEVTGAASVESITVGKTATTLNLLVQALADIYDLNVTHVATMFRTIIKDYVSSETFIPGLMGEGMKIYKALNGDWNLEIDNIVVRKVMTIFELVVSKIRSVNGGLVISPANGRIKSVAETTGNPAYYILGIEGDNQFVFDDLVRCQVFTSGQAKYYWVPVASVTADSILVLKSEFIGAVPAIGDDLIQMGNRTNRARQGLLYLAASEDGKPRFSVMDGVNSTSTAGKSKVILGCLDGMTDTDFPADFQLSGYGLYAMNVFLKGVFLLRNGKSVESEIESVKSDAQTVKDKADAITRLFQEFTVAGGLFESKITEVKTYADGKVNGLQVGGRNLFRNGDKGWRSDRFTSITTYDILGDHIGKQATISFDIKASISRTLAVYHYQGSGISIAVTGACVPLTDKYTRFCFTGNVLSNPVPDGYSRGSIGIYDYDGSNVIYVKNIKVELGNKATDWTPAPEDVAADAQTKANAAQAAAEAVAIAKAALAKTEASAYADGIVSSEEQRAINDAKAKLEEAKRDAQAKADAAKSAAIGASALDAQTKANAAQAAAEAVAIAKAALAKTEASAYADGIVSSEEQRAINDAKAKLEEAKRDAQAKADAAKQAAINDAAQKYPTHSEVQSSIRQTKDEINLSVSEKISNVQVGGRNLFRNGDKGWRSDRFTSITTYDILGDHIGKQATISFDIKASISRTLAVYHYQGSGISIAVTGACVPLTDKYTRFCFTGNVLSNPVPDGYSRGSIGIYDYDGSNVIYVKNIKVELGNKATDWTPAPEDVAADAQTKANAAQAAAEAVAIAKAALAKTEASAYADGIVTAEEQRAIADAQAKLNEAKQDAQNKAEAAKQAAITDAAQKYPTQSEVQSSIRQTKDEINLSVSEKISNVQVGGRNLALYSGSAITNDYYCVVNYELSEELISGGTYIITLLGQLGEGKAYFGAWMGGGYTHVGYLKKIEEGKYQLCFAAPNTVSGNGRRDRIDIYSVSDAVVVTSYIYKFKLERGNKATDWTPAPEDVQDQITANTSAIEVNRQGITLKVSKDELLSTGIDISNRKIVLTSDKVVFQNNSGGQIALFENNCIKTSLINAREIVTGALLAEQISATNITTGKLTVTDGATIGGFTVKNEFSGYSLTNNDLTAKIVIQASNNKYLRIGGRESTLISMRIDGSNDGVANNGIFIQSYGRGNKCLELLANAGSEFAIKSHGPHLFGQRSGEIWNAPGVLWAGRMNAGGGILSSWGNGLNVTPSIHRYAVGKYSITHNLGHTNYYPIAIAEVRTNSDNYWGIIARYTGIISSAFSIEFKNDGGSDEDPKEFQVMIFGRNKW